MKRIILSLIVGCLLHLGGLVTVFAQTNALSLKLDDETRRLLRELTEDKWFKKDNFVSTLLGGALAIAGGLAASLQAHWLQVRHKGKADKEFAANVLRAIRRELEALGEIHDKGIGAHLAKLGDGQIFEVRLALTQDWFTVFDANAVHLGQLDAEISRRIVTVYALMKALIEEYRINNGYIEARAQIQFQWAATNPPRDIDLKDEKVREWLLQQAARIRVAHAASKSATEELYHLLDLRGIK